MKTIHAFGFDVTAAAKLTRFIMREMMNHSWDYADSIFRTMDCLVGSEDVAEGELVNTNAYTALADKINDEIQRRRKCSFTGKPIPQGIDERLLAVFQEALLLAHRRYTELETI